MHDVKIDERTKVDRLVSLTGIHDELGTLTERVALLVQDYSIMRDEAQG